MHISRLICLSGFSMVLVLSGTVNAQEPPRQGQENFLSRALFATAASGFCQMRASYYRPSFPERRFAWMSTCPSRRLISALPTAFYRR